VAARGGEEQEMYASVRRYRLDSGSIDELMHRVDRDFADAMAREPGFVAYQAVDCGESTLCTITTFHDEDKAQESNERAAEWVAANLADFDLARTEVMGGEVMVSRASDEVLEPAHH
jgi:hypothetical protein